MASPLIRDLYFLILQCLYEYNCNETAQKLEQESKVFFNTLRFKKMIWDANWDEAEKYLRSFTAPEDNPNSMKIYLIIGRQKYLEALDESNCVKAVDIFNKDLKCLLKDDSHMAEELLNLLTLNNFRQNQEYSNYGNTSVMRAQLVQELDNLIKTNPSFHEKLSFPRMDRGRLKTVIVQSLRHHIWGNDDNELPVRSSLLVDQRCEQSSQSPAKKQRTTRVENELVHEAGPSTSGTEQKVQNIEEKID